MSDKYIFGIRVYNGRRKAPVRLVQLTAAVFLVGIFTLGCNVFMEGYEKNTSTYTRSND